MSEEILKALMQLFAIISKQDDGVCDAQRNFVLEFLKFQLTAETVEEYIKLYDEKAGYIVDNEVIQTQKVTSVNDSVRIMGLCLKINKTLSQKQKIIVVIRLFELVKNTKQLTLQRMQIIATIFSAFKISREEEKLIENFVINDNIFESLTADNLIIHNKRNNISDKTSGDSNFNQIYSSGLDDYVRIIKVNSANLYFLKYSGSSEIFLNSFAINKFNVQLIASGSTLRLPKGTLYFSDIVASFSKNSNDIKISFIAENIGFKFPNNQIGLRDITIKEDAGNLIGIMGGSGVGKSTLLNVLSGLEKPSSGSIRINGIDINLNKSKVDGLIGYIAQDDLLIEELTVFQNLYYNTKLCFKDILETELNSKVNEMLINLGLQEIADIKVGHVLNKKISGGQRKRLNIALEIIRETPVLFVDEPTSGLSSRDSENVMDLLKELALRGKLIFVVIHQPSSDILKMFDKLFLLDKDGYAIYYGNPIDAVTYFKKAANQLNSHIGECQSCGTVNPESLFNIIEAKVIGDYGKFTNKRKVSAEEWNVLFKENIKVPDLVELKDEIPRAFHIPNKLQQFFVFVKRDLLSKISNTQYLAIALLEAPLLGFILAFIIKYVPNSIFDSDEYVFRLNENIPAFIFMTIIVVLFIGLTVSAEEIFRDKKILKRESFLNLSRTSYLLSKIFILFTLSAIQTLTFVIISNYIIGLKGMYLNYWLMLFTVSCLANVLGLIVSSAFDSAVSIYILIPLLIIPQMILGGAMFTFDKINRGVGGGSDVPFLASFIPSRWAYEGLMVNQFMNNKYEKPLYDFEKKESILNYKQSYFIAELQDIVDACQLAISDTSLKSIQLRESELKVLRNELIEESKLVKAFHFKYIDSLNVKSFNENVAEQTNEYLIELKEYYAAIFNKVNGKKNNFLATILNFPEKEALFLKNKNDYSNDNLTHIVKKSSEENKLIIRHDRIIQQVDPIFLDPVKNDIIDVRAHFLAPRKNFISGYISTFYFNIIILWFFVIGLYLILYFDLLKKLISLTKYFSTENS